MERVICLLIGYVFGLFQTAYFYGKAKGIDIRKYGSGNAGTTNALRVLGTKAGLIVLAGDCLKCIIAVCITRALFSTGHPENIYLLCLYTGAGAVIGHNFPFYMGFKGGKGIAATAGLILSLHPYRDGCGIVFRHFPDHTLCFAGIIACICRIYDPDGSLRTDGTVRCHATVTAV